MKITKRDIIKNPRIKLQVGDSYSEPEWEDGYEVIYNGNFDAMRYDHCIKKGCFALYDAIGAINNYRFSKKENRK